jgi:serine/threonine protein kinase
MRYLQKSLKYQQKNQLGGNFELKCITRNNEEKKFNKNNDIFIKEQDGTQIEIMVIDGNHAELGRGAFGRVVKGKMTNTNMPPIEIAIKIIENVLSITNVMSICNELNILNKNANEYVPEYYGYCYNENTLYIFMELVVGSEMLIFIKNIFANIETLNGDELLNIQNIITKLLNGLMTIHNNNIVHRDIKPENIIITSNKGIKYIDFGLSCIYNESCNRIPFGLLSGTPEFIPYDNYVDHIQYKKLWSEYIQKFKANDIWALGCTIYELLTGNSFNSFQKIDPNITPEEQKEKRYENYFSNMEKTTDDILTKININLVKSRLFIAFDQQYKETIKIIFNFLMQFEYQKRSIEYACIFNRYYNRYYDINDVIALEYELVDDVLITKLIIKQFVLENTNAIQKIVSFKKEDKKIIIYYEKLINFKTLKDILDNMNTIDISDEIVRNLLHYINEILIIIQKIHEKNISGLKIDKEHVLVKEKECKLSFVSLYDSRRDKLKQIDDYKELYKLAKRIFINGYMDTHNVSELKYSNINQTLKDDIKNILDTIKEKTLTRPNTPFMDNR